MIWKTILTLTMNTDSNTLASLCCVEYIPCTKLFQPLELLHAVQRSKAAVAVDVQFLQARQLCNLGDRCETALTNHSTHDEYKSAESKQQM